MSCPPAQLSVRLRAYRTHAHPNLEVMCGGYEGWADVITASCALSSRLPACFCTGGRIISSFGDVSKCEADEAFVPLYLCSLKGPLSKSRNAFLR